MDIIIRDITKEDYPFVLKLNEENVEVLSPMDDEQINYFSKHAALFKIVEVDGKRAAFLIAMREGTDYWSENYIWFSNRYERFLYVDRIVIDVPYRKLGIGRKLYGLVAEQGMAQGVSVITAEVDTEPIYNNTSLEFHRVMGFKEVGEQYVRNGTIKVSLQAKEQMH